MQSFMGDFHNSSSVDLCEASKNEVVSLLVENPEIKQVVKKEAAQPIIQSVAKENQAPA